MFHTIDKKDKKEVTNILQVREKETKRARKKNIRRISVKNDKGVPAMEWKTLNGNGDNGENGLQPTRR